MGRRRASPEYDFACQYLYDTDRHPILEIPLFDSPGRRGSAQEFCTRAELADGGMHHLRKIREAGHAGAGMMTGEDPRKLCVKTGQMKGKPLLLIIISSQYDFSEALKASHHSR